MLVRLPRSTMKRTLLVLKVIFLSFLVLLLVFRAEFGDERIFNQDPSEDILVVETDDRRLADKHHMDFVYIDTEEAIPHQLSGRELKSIDVLVLQPWSSSSQSLQDEANRFLTYINTPQVRCRDVREVGKEYRPDDAKNATWHWRVCFDPKMKVTAFQGHWEDIQCLVYSFGTDLNDRGFDMGMSELGCEVHAFVPSRKIASQSAVADHGQLVVHHTSLDWKDSMLSRHQSGQWRTRRLIGIMDDLGHQQVDILRADLGSSEWKVLENIVTDGTVKRIHQLLVKVYVHWSGFEVTGSDASIVRYWYSILKRLEGSGFKLYSVTRDDVLPQRFLGKDQFNASCCYTLSWLNTQWNGGLR
ncbi:probable methyltransferase-like protein 24 [Ptychodera flava]|uniref:probable methyltransferase-like protein 24 n=1 Tax=Ptychodera flava TaxID=63121 RepID=UPI003969F7A7